MAVMSLPSTMSDFEGEISHVVVAGTETLIFVKLSTWKGEQEKINIKLQTLAPSFKKVTSVSAVKSGEAYIVKMKDSFKRSYIIRRPSPETFSIYLIDKGMQCEIQFGEIYEFPPELLEFGMFSCVCPVLVPSSEELNTYESFVGYKCKCTVEAVSKSIVVMGFVRGRLLVEIEGHYKDLHDVVFGKKANRPGDGGVLPAKLHLSTGRHLGHVRTGQIGDTSSSSNDSTFHRQFIQKAEYKTNTNTRPLFPDRKDFLMSRTERHDKPIRASTDYVAEYERAKMGTLFNQTAFKQYVPEMLPMKLSVRFDKRDRMISTFWVVHKKIFTAAERALKEVSNQLSRFPPVNCRIEDIQMRQTPCIARARADTPHRTLFRAVPSQYDPRTKRVSIFLVDFGWFKWVLANDVFDISAMDCSDPIKNLPVAMIHCREDTTSTLHAKDLIRGTSCEIIIKGNAQRNVYTVDILGSPFMTNPIDDASSEQTLNENGTVVGNMRETEVISSCKKLVTETCQRQLMTSMMMETLSIAGRELAQQPQNFWPGFCSPSFPMTMPVMMPVLFPVMFPWAIQNTNLQDAADSVAVRARNNTMAKPQNMMTNNFEGGNFSNNNPRAQSGASRAQSGIPRTQSGAPRAQPGPRVTNNKRSPKVDYMQKSGSRFQSSGSQLEKEKSRDDRNTRNGLGIIPSEKKQMPRNSCEEENNELSWDLPPKYVKQRRTFQKNCDNNMVKDLPTNWEKAIEADRADRNDQDENPSGSSA